MKTNNYLIPISEQDALLIFGGRNESVAKTLEKLAENVGYVAQKVWKFVKKMKDFLSPNA